MDFFIDDLINKLLEMRNDGFMYCTFDVMSAEEDFPARICFEAIDDGGCGTVDYSDEDTDVYPVSEEEISVYAFRHKQPPKERDTLKVTFET